MSDAATAVAAAPFVALLQPYLTAAATAIVGGAITLGAAALRKWTGVQIDAASIAAIHAECATEAGKAIAAATDNLATAKIDVNSTLVAAATDAIAQRAPELLKAAGLTPDDLDHIITGEIGKLQARMTSVAPSPAPALPPP